MQSNQKQPRRWQSAAVQFAFALIGLLTVAAVLVACRPVAAPAEAPIETATAVATEAAPAEVPMIGDPERGGYIFAVTTGCGCHFNKDLGGPAGGNKFEGPFGVVYAPNITSDSETGIGSWSETDIVNALRLGVRPDGSQLFPIMPYMAMSNLADQDAYDLAAALKQVPPVSNEVPASELANPPAPFTPAQAAPAVAPTTGAERGAYLVAVANCSQCHTPRGADGAPDMSRFLAGATMKDTIVPNLTPDASSDIGILTTEQIANFLATGVYEDGSEVDGGMKRIIANGTSKLTQEDRLAIAEYLKSLPPVASE